jgi:hypothetical protein
MTHGLLASGKLYRAFETLCVSFETDSNRLYTWPFHHTSPMKRSNRSLMLVVVFSVLFT